MKAFKGFLGVLLFGWIMIACGGGGSSESSDSTSDLSSQEQAEIVAAALTADQGGIGKDIEEIANPATIQSQGAVTLELAVSADVSCFDADDQPQAQCDAYTTDTIEYESVIQGRFSSSILFFQDFVIDNYSEFTATGLLSGHVLIEGTHNNHSSYARSASFNNVEVYYNLDSELAVRDLIVDLNAWDAIPEAGTVEGTVSGDYERSSSYNQTAVGFSFHFIATYVGHNTAHIELSNGALFSVHLGSCTVSELD